LPGEPAEQPEVKASVSETEPGDHQFADAQPAERKENSDQPEFVTQDAEPAQHAEAKPTRRRRSRFSADASEPRLERVVVTSPEADDGKTTDTQNKTTDTQNEETPAPTRKGWWQRRLGGE
jgi:Mrp family chromosome partitioning ATPase